MGESQQQQTSIGRDGDANLIGKMRIPTKSAAYSDASRPAVPVDVGRLFRLKSATP